MKTTSSPTVREVQALQVEVEQMKQDLAVARATLKQLQADKETVESLRKKLDKAERERKALEAEISVKLKQYHQSYAEGHGCSLVAKEARPRGHHDGEDGLVRG